MTTSQVAIVGAGVAGLSAARVIASAGISTIVLDPMGSGGQLALMTSIRNWPAQEDAPALAQRLLMDALKAGVSLVPDEVVGLTPGQPNVVRTASEEYRADAVIVATGGRPKPLPVANWEAWEGRGISFCAECDAEFFRGQPVAAIAGNPWAAAEVIHLSHVVSNVLVVTEGPTLESVASAEAELAACENVRTSCDTQVVGLNTSATGIESLVLRRDGQDTTETVAGIFVCTKPLPRVDFLHGALAEAEGGGLAVDEVLSTSAPGIFAAGVVRAGCLNTFKAAAEDGVVAGLKAVEYCRPED